MSNSKIKNLISSILSEANWDGRISSYDEDHMKTINQSPSNRFAHLQSIYMPNKKVGDKYKIEFTPVMTELSVDFDDKKLICKADAKDAVVTQLDTGVYYSVEDAGIERITQPLGEFLNLKELDDIRNESAKTNSPLPLKGNYDTETLAEMLNKYLNNLDNIEHEDERVTYKAYVELIPVTIEIDDKGNKVIKRATEILSFAGEPEKEVNKQIIYMRMPENYDKNLLDNLFVDNRRKRYGGYISSIYPPYRTYFTIQPRGIREKDKDSKIYTIGLYSHDNILLDVLNVQIGDITEETGFSHSIDREKINSDKALLGSNINSLIERLQYIEDNFEKDYFGLEYSLSTNVGSKGRNFNTFNKREALYLDADYRTKIKSDLSDTLVEFIPSDFITSTEFKGNDRRGVLDKILRSLCSEYGFKISINADNQNLFKTGLYKATIFLGDERVYKQEFWLSQKSAQYAPDGIYRRFDKNIKFKVNNEQRLINKTEVNQSYSVDLVIDTNFDNDSGIKDQLTSLFEFLKNPKDNKHEAVSKEDIDEFIKTVTTQMNLVVGKAKKSKDDFIMFDLLSDLQCTKLFATVNNTQSGNTYSFQNTTIKGAQKLRIGIKLINNNFDELLYKLGYDLKVLPLLNKADVDKRLSDNGVSILTDGDLFKSSYVGDIRQIYVKKEEKKDIDIFGIQNKDNMTEDDIVDGILRIYNLHNKQFVTEEILDNMTKKIGEYLFGLRNNGGFRIFQDYKLLFDKDSITNSYSDTDDDSNGLEDIEFTIDMSSSDAGLSGFTPTPPDKKDSNIGDIFEIKVDENNQQILIYPKTNKFEFHNLLSLVSYIMKQYITYLEKKKNNKEQETKESSISKYTTLVEAEDLPKEIYLSFEDFEPTKDNVLVGKVIVSPDVGSDGLAIENPGYFKFNDEDIRETILENFDESNYENLIVDYEKAVPALSDPEFNAALTKYDPELNSIVVEEGKFAIPFSIWNLVTHRHSTGKVTSNDFDFIESQEFKDKMMEYIKSIKFINGENE